MILEHYFIIQCLLFSLTQLQPSCCRENSNFLSVAQFRQLDQCTQKCGLCSKSKSCDCYQGYFLEDESCVATCSDSYYLVKEQNKCMKCHKTCKKCTSIEENQCTECFNQFYLDSGYCYSEGKRTFIVVVLVVILGLVISTLCLLKRIFRKEKDREEINQKIQKEQEEIIRKRNLQNKEKMDANKQKQNNNEQLEIIQISDGQNKIQEINQQISLPQGDVNNNKKVKFVKSEVQDVTFKPQLFQKEEVELNQQDFQQILNNNNFNIDSLNTDGDLLSEKRNQKNFNISHRQSKKFQNANDLIKEFEENQRILGISNNNNLGTNPLQQFSHEDLSEQASKLMEKDLIKNSSVLVSNNQQYQDDDNNNIYQFSDEEQDKNKLENEINDKQNPQISEEQNQDSKNSSPDGKNNGKESNNTVQDFLKNNPEQNNIRDDIKSQSSEEQEQRPPLFFKLPRVGPPQDMMVKTQEQFQSSHKFQQKELNRSRQRTETQIMELDQNSQQVGDDFDDDQQKDREEKKEQQ